MSDTAPATLEAFGAGYLRLRALVSDAAQAQWQAGQSPVPKEDTTERSKGLVNDPTVTITLDPRRLVLRASVIEAEDAIAKADQTLRAAIHHLERALVAWQG